MLNAGRDNLKTSRPLFASLAVAALLALVLVLSGCGSTPSSESGERLTWNGRPIGAPPAAQPAVKRAMIQRATREWEVFGRQIVVYEGAKESIPNVGYWEDDDGTRASRVNAYWRAVGKSRLDGYDCRQPWSAAFVGYIMQSAGVPRSQLKRTSAHWVYLANAIDAASFRGRWFVPRRISDYSPEPGDLICAYRNGRRPASYNGYTSARALRGVPSHCDLVVSKSGSTLEAIGGNVRNSVSKTRLTLNSSGRLQPVARRPWFLVLQNRL